MNIFYVVKLVPEEVKTITLEERQNDLTPQDF